MTLAVWWLQNLLSIWPPPPPNCSPEQQISSDESIMLTKLYCIQNNQWHVLIFLASNGPFPSPWGHNLNKIVLILQAIWLLRNGFLKHIRPYFHSLLWKRPGMLFERITWKTFTLWQLLNKVMKKRLKM